MARTDPSGRVWPTAKAPPAGLSTGTVCEQLGMSMARLLGHVKRGELPSFNVFNGEPLWSLQYALLVHNEGLSLPGTFEGFPPGFDEARELSRWAQTGKGAQLRYTRRRPRRCPATRPTRKGKK